ETIGTQRIEPKSDQAVIATEALEIIRAPHLSIVAARTGWIDIRHIDHAQRGGILEKQAERVSALQHFPVVIPLVTEAAILRIGDVQIPWFACHLKTQRCSDHKAEEVI